jgi:hypothetical protein
MIGWILWVVSNQWRSSALLATRMGECSLSLTPDTIVSVTRPDIMNSHLTGVLILVYLDNPDAVNDLLINELNVVHQ